MSIAVSIPSAPCARPCIEIGHAVSASAEIFRKQPSKRHAGIQPRGEQSRPLQPLGF